MSLPKAGRRPRAIVLCTMLAGVVFLLIVASIADDNEIDTQPTQLIATGVGTDHGEGRVAESLDRKGAEDQDHAFLVVKVVGYGEAGRAGVPVLVENLAGRSLAAGNTADDGTFVHRFTIPVRISIEVGGRLCRILYLSTCTTYSVDVYLKDLYVVKGTVTWNGAVVPNATVWQSSRYKESVSRLARTDASGRFIAMVSQIEEVIWAKDGERRSEAYRIQDLPRIPEGWVAELPLMNGKERLEFRIVCSGEVQSDERPIASARVRVERVQRWIRYGAGVRYAINQEMVTDSRGGCAFGGLTPGQYTVTVSAEGYAPYLGEFAVSSDDDSVRHIGLKPGLSLEIMMPHCGFVGLADGGNGSDCEVVLEAGGGVMNLTSVPVRTRYEASSGSFTKGQFLFAYCPEEGTCEEFVVLPRESAWSPALGGEDSRILKLTGADGDCRWRLTTGGKAIEFSAGSNPRKFFVPRSRKVEVELWADHLPSPVLASSLDRLPAELDIDLRRALCRVDVHVVGNARIVWLESDQGIRVPLRPMRDGRWSGERVLEGNYWVAIVDEWGGTRFLEDHAVSVRGHAVLRETRRVESSTIRVIVPNSDGGALPLRAVVRKVGARAAVASEYVSRDPDGVLIPCGSGTYVVQLSWEGRVVEERRCEVIPGGRTDCRFEGVPASLQRFLLAERFRGSERVYMRVEEKVAVEASIWWDGIGGHSSVWIPAGRYAVERVDLTPVGQVFDAPSAPVTLR